MSSLQKIKSELDMFQIDTDKSQYDKLCQENKFTDKLIGYSMLITELEERGIVHNQLNESIQNIFTLIKNIKDEKDILKCIDVLTNHGTLKNDFIYIKETYKGYE